MKPLLRGHFHQAMFFTTLGAGVPLVLRAKTGRELLATSVYVLCALTLFGVSALYHRVNWSPEVRQLWRKLDHSSIYLMIAGTFTPVALLGLSADSYVKLLWTIWIVAILGIARSLFFANAHKGINAVIYLIAGYLVLPYIFELKQSLGVANCALLVAGGLSYSVGAVCYGLKKPMLNPAIFSYHEVFHVLVNTGAIFHFLVINSMIK